MKPGRTSRQSQRDCAALLCLLTPLIARLTCSVRQKKMRTRKRRKRPAVSVPEEKRRGLSFYLFCFAALFTAFIGLELLLGVGLSRNSFGHRINRSREAGKFSIAVSVTAVALGLAWYEKRRRPNQSPQRNAGSRPSSGDSPTSENSSSLGPRG